MVATIERIREQDTEAVLRLLKTNGLPIEGLTDHLQTTLVAREGDTVFGSAGLEVYADGALLRSLAVAVDRQRAGLGHRLTEAAVELARELGVPALYLLTTTAEQYFPRFGFERVMRADVPSTVQRSIEFTSACPSSAAVMRKAL